MPNEQPQPDIQVDATVTVKPVDNFDKMMRFLKEFGLPVALCCVLMYAGWVIIGEDRAAQKLEREQHNLEQKNYQDKLINLTTQGNTALDKVGDAIEDVSKGLGEVKEQGERIEAAFDRLTGAIENKQ